MDKDKIIEERERSYEYGLPSYLQHDLDAYKKGLEEKSSLLDCLWGELYGSINIAEINNPKLLDKVFTDFTNGASKDELRFVSNSKLYGLKAEMEDYIQDICKKAKDGKITKDSLKKMKNKNLVASGINFAAGFAVAALFLSTLIPKFQYWVTRQKTGKDEFPGTYELEKEIAVV